MGRKLKRIAVAGGLALLLAAAPLAAYLFPTLIGADQALIVLTGSMQPALEPGDIVFLTPVAIDEIEVGDVITFHPHTNDPRTFTHRVVAIDHEAGGPVLTTKGDHNEDPDPFRVDADMLVGRVDTTLPFYGKIIAAFGHKLLHLALIVISILTVGVELQALLARGEEHPPAEGRRFQVVDRS